MTDELDHQLPWQVTWKDVISLAVPLLSVLGLALYAVSSFAYAHFYSSLGTSPADVGLTYFGVLAASTGWAIALAFGLAFVVPILMALLPVVRLGGIVSEQLRMSDIVLAAPFRYGWPVLLAAIRDREWRLPKEEQEARWNARTAQAEAALDREWAWRDQVLHTEIEPGAKLGQLWADGVVGRLILVVVLSLFLSLLVIDPIHHTLQFAEQVKAGRSGNISAGLFGLPLVRLRADEVRVSSAGEAGQFPAVDRLRGRRLIYLGRADNTVVLYDSGHRAALYVPASTLVLEVRGR
jgi:hypothetical protein